MADYDMRPVYRYEHWLGRWVFKCSGRMLTPCRAKFGT